MATLGTIPQMLLPVMLTLVRGNPPVKETVRVAMDFDNVALDTKNIREYTAFCGFDEASGIPASWLYLLAQRAQIRLMLESDFPLPTPGMVHITNSVEMLRQPAIEQPVTVHVEAEIPGKSSGSLLPRFDVVMQQGADIIARITSGYIVKRGGGEKTAETVSEQSTETRHRSADIDYLKADFSAAKDGGKIIMPRSIGWDYAKVSGDFNPIHIAGFAAKAFGLPGKLVHGWYSVSMAISVIERLTAMRITAINVQFAKPVLMPATVNIEYCDIDPNRVLFRMTSLNKKGETVVHLAGSLA